MKIGGKKPGGMGSGSFVKKSGEAGPANKTEGPSGKAQAGGASGSGDSVDLSPKARDLNRAKTLLDNVPDVRETKVVRLKTDIEKGDYAVDSEKVAEKMIEKAITDAITAAKK